MNNDISSASPKNAIQEEIPIPPEILELQRKEQRFKILTPVLGFSLVSLCFISMALMKGEWKLAILILALAMLATFWGSAFSMKHIRETDDVIKDIVNRRR